MKNTYTVKQVGTLWHTLCNGILLTASDTKPEAELIATRYALMDAHLAPGWKAQANRS